jgi:hypothetical protein
MARQSGDSNFYRDTEIAIQASLLARDLRTLVATLRSRLVLLDGMETAEFTSLRSAKEAAERALALADNLIAITAKR